MRRSRLVSFILLSVLVALGARSIVAWLDSATLAVDLPPLVRTEFAAIAGATPPAVDAAWHETILPDDWQKDRRPIVEGWHRLRFHVADDAAPWAVYIPAVHMNAAAWVNGRFVGDGGRFEDPVARNWNRPLFFPISRHLLVPGENLLHIRVKADRAGGGLLSPVYVGRDEPLRAAYTRRFSFRVTALRGIAISQTVLLLFLTALWAQRRRDTVYGWFAAASLAWTLTWPNLLVVAIPVPARVWVLLWYLAGGWFVLFLVCFVLDFIGERSPRINRALLLWGLVGSTVLAVLAASGSSWFEAGARAWAAPQYAAGAYAVGRVGVALWRNPTSFELRVAYVSGLVLVGCALQDWPILVGLLGREHSFYVPYAAPLCQSAMGLILVRRMVAALRRSEALAADLDRRIEETRRDLERSEERSRAVERKRVLAEERERLMREMHDGLGSHLVSTLALVERSDVPPVLVGDAVRGALDDLRLMVESLEPADGDLLPALGQLRSRLQPRLEAAGLRVEWRAGDVPSIEGFGPRQVLQVLRIVEEAVTNVLRHAAARTLTIRTTLAETDDGTPAVSIEVVDDGQGVGSAPSHGLGMDNMRRRAREMEAVLDVMSSSTGTVVRLRVPLGRYREETLDRARRG